MSTRSAGPRVPGHARWAIEPVQVGARRLALKQISHDAVLAAVADGEPDPYWAHVWPAGRSLAGFVLAGPALDGLRCLDLGAGSGVVGVALGLRGAHVTFADLHEDALQLAEENARRCGLTAFETLRLDWREPPARTFDRIYAADVAYEPDLLEPLAKALRQLLAPGGSVWLSDPNRPPMPRLLALAQAEGLEAEQVRERRGIRIFRLRRPGR